MKLTPEMIAALEAALGGPGDAPDHPDAPQDYEMICQVIEEKLAPSFEIIGKELASLRQENDSLKDIVYKLITSFSDAVGQHRMGGIRESVLPKYAGDLGTIGPMAKDLLGKDIEAELLDALMNGDGDPDEIANGVLGPYKEKFGKYLGGAPAPGKEVSVEVESKPAEEGHGKLDLEPPKEEVKEDAESGDPVTAMFNKVRSVGRPRKTA